MTYMDELLDVFKMGDKASAADLAVKMSRINGVPEAEMRHKVCHVLRRAEGFGFVSPAYTVRKGKMKYTVWERVG